ncbi:hypothetical protein CVT24_006127 [Panaeolus cyanescens]|uniref:Lysine-specific metallo-endopeptidase domain-containing protein n=1 Tax=Panaeolus cyanescens TaxID=181874 RepID=A0A409YDT6_9AGAR|nr:hypothetical protein CVT24_006127 [Panaeolus cyanescens]
MAANNQLKGMRQIVTGAMGNDRIHLDTLAYIFGNNYDIQGVNAVLTALEGMTIRIGSYDDPTVGSAWAVADYSTGKVILGKSFWQHGTNAYDHKRPWVLIHEASHLCGTRDWWDWDNEAKTKVHPALQVHTSQDGLVGYSHEDYEAPIGTRSQCAVFLCPKKGSIPTLGAY